MPIHSCSKNGKPGYMWGQGPSSKCYPYNPNSDSSKTKARNKARHQGIAEIVNNFELSLAKQKISFDYDGVLSTDKGKELVKSLIKTNDIYIITARIDSGDNSDLFNIASELGISKDHIYFTNHKDKWEKIKDLGIQRHYDNNKEQIDKINKNTKANGILI